MTSTTSIKYIGKRATYTDGTYGTGICFAQGESKLVPVDKARLMLRHADVYVAGDVDAEVAFVAEPKQNDDENSQDMRDAIAVMDKAALEVYAKTNFRINVDKRKSLETLRTEVVGLIDRFGAV